MGYLPFIVALVINIGLIIINVVDLATYRKKYTTICRGVSNSRNHVRSNITGIIFSIIIILLTYVLCSRNKEEWAWFVVLLPFIIGFIMFLVLVAKMKRLTYKDVIKHTRE